MGARNSNIENVYFLIEIHCTFYIDVYLSAVPKPALVEASRHSYNADKS